ncbi:peptidoglycan D,D-transpeptidase FtsI family protein [Thalassobacillus hwangdonensis]|uniref:Peptidoglycan D,D-transpeptidase FtsI family protein n=1 Tax=Thalassobacillus hwangdonensis TaxID=546108 RepID=A0ABW3L2I7_9BACI
MRRKRLYIWMICLIAGFAGLIYKLMDIQLFHAEDYGPSSVNLLEESVNQRSSKITLSDGRGVFVDRNGSPLHYTSKKDIVVFPFVQGVTDLSHTIRERLGVSEQEWNTWFTDEKQPFFLSDKWMAIPDTMYDEVEKLKLPGLIAVERKSEVDEGGADHLLGITRSDKEGFDQRYPERKGETPVEYGLTGLEKAFDPFLSGKGEQVLQYHVDAMGNPLLGMDMRLRSMEDTFYPLELRTTLDKNLQERLERIVLQSNMKEGGAVLLDVEKREVLALVSLPSINKQDPYANNNASNRMLMPFNPGSVFKTVIAAAALENHPEALLQTYDCNLDLYGKPGAERQLGSLSFTDSFAQSCNYTFGQVANELASMDRNLISLYADKLGLMDRVGWSGQLFHYDAFRQLPEEGAGTIWGDGYDPGVEDAIRQTAIGQKNVKVTPLAVANMMATIAEDGVYKNVKAVNEIAYHNGSMMYRFETKPEQRFSSVTAVKLQQLLEQVVDAGTGTYLANVEVAGKSGTAETGKKNTNHYWFAGYFPRKDPKYALALVELNQKPADQSLYDTYSKIVHAVSDTSDDHSVQ